MALGNDSLESVLSSAQDIVKIPERNSTIHGLKKLAEWLAEGHGEFIDVAPVEYESPRGKFKLRFKPDFGIVNDKITGVHIWNTLRPEIRPRETFAALSLVAGAYNGEPGAPFDLAVLSLRNSTVYRLGDGPDFSLIGRRMAASLEDLMTEIEDELGTGIGESTEDRPHR